MILRLIITLTILVPLFSLGQSDSSYQSNVKWLQYGTERPDTIIAHPRSDTTFYQILYRSDSIKRAEGMILNGQWSGTWTYYFEDGITIRKKETYLEGKLEGSYEEYYRNGTLKETGFFKTRAHKVTTASYYKSGCPAYLATFNEDGKEDGDIRFYYDCDSINKTLGQIEFEYTAVSGIPVGKATRYYQDGKIKEEIEFDFNGQVISQKKWE